MWKGFRKIVSIIVAIILFLFIFLPVVWVFITAFKERSAVTSTNPFYLGESFPVLNNFYEIFERWVYMDKLRNSFVVSISCTVLSMVVGLPAAYAFSRFKFRGRLTLLSYIISFRFLPPTIIAIPLFILFSKSGLIDTYYGLVIADVTFTLPFVIWLSLGFFEDIPRDIVDSALVDGCSTLGAFWKIVMPMLYNGITVIFLFSFIFCWNEFVLAFVLTRSAACTVPVTIATFIGSFGMPIEWGLVCAATLIYVVPVTLLSFILQKYIVRGLTFGAVKG